MLTGRSPSLRALALLIVALGLLAGFFTGRGDITRALDAFHAAIGLPLAVPDVAVVSAGVEAQTISVLSNDRDSNGDALEIVGIADAVHGTLWFDGAVVRYSPNPGYVGLDRGRYTIRDPGGGGSSAEILIHVVRNEPPMALPDFVTLPSPGGEVDVLANDLDPEGGPLRVVTVRSGSGGTATIRGGAVEFLAAAGFAGIEKIEYTVEDALGLTSRAWIEVNVPSGGCTGESAANLDEDADGYDNADEMVNGTAPCDATSIPSDADEDRTSDRLDPYYLDPHDGLATLLPVELTFDAPIDGTVVDTGMTGLMSNGTDPADLLDPAKVRVDDGELIVDSSPHGDAFGAENAQRNALQLGIRMPAEPFVVHGRLLLPFSGDRFQSAGIYVGSGLQDDYLKLAVSAAGGDGGVKVTYEVAGEGKGAAIRRDPEILSSAEYVDLFITIDPATRIAASSYAINGGHRRGLGDSARLSIPDGWTNGPRALAVGVVVTPELGGSPYAGHWDLLEVTEP